MFKKIFYLLPIIAVFIFTGAGCIIKSSSAIGDTGMFMSIDKGDKWEAASVMPTAEGMSTIAQTHIYKMFDDPSDTNAYYLGTRGQGLYYTYNSGISWNKVTAEQVVNKFIYALAVDPKDKCNIYASDGTHIYKTKDCSRTWELIYTEERVDQKFASLAIDYGSGAIYAAEQGGDIMMSVDAGKSWAVIKRFDMPLKDLQIDPLTPARIYVAAESGGLFRSDNAGLDWVNLNEGLNKFNDSKKFFRLALNPAVPNGIFWVSKYGILKSDDAGVNWTDLRLLTPPGAVSIYGFAVNPNNQNEIYYTGSILDDKNNPVKSTFYKSSDAGLTWVTKKLPTGSIPVVIKVHPQKDNILFMGFALLN